MTETILFETHPSLRKDYFATVLIAVPLGLLHYLIGSDPIAQGVLSLLFVLVLLRLFYVYVRYLYIVYRITDQYVGLEEGIIAQKQKRAPWLKITNFTSEQTILGRFLGLADVRIDTPGQDVWEIEYFNVRKKDAEQIIALFNEYVPDAKGPEEGEAQVEADREK